MNGTGLHRRTAIIITVIMAVLAVACNGGHGGKAGKASGKASAALTRSFPTVQVPEMYQEDMDALLEYSTKYFWKDFAGTGTKYLCDSSHIGGVLREDVEQQYSNFAWLLRMASPAQQKTAMQSMFSYAAACEKADTSSNVFEELTALTEKYLYDPNSPLRDEDVYGAYAAELAQYEGFAPEKRLVYEHQARLCSLNAKGTPAADFYFCDARGNATSLYDVNAAYTLLFFSNPGCEACYEIIQTLSQDVVDQMIARGTLAVVNVYIDEDIQAWRDYMPIYPHNWHNGFDPQGVIRSDLLYNVRAIPSLYLLDKDKTVLLKDAPNDVVFNALNEIIAEDGV